MDCATAFIQGKGRNRMTKRLREEEDTEQIQAWEKLLSFFPDEADRETALDCLTTILEEDARKVLKDLNRKKQKKEAELDLSGLIQDNLYMDVILLILSFIPDFSPMWIYPLDMMSQFAGTVLNTLSERERVKQAAFTEETEREMEKKLMHILYGRFPNQPRGDKPHLLFNRLFVRMDHIVYSEQEAYRNKFLVKLAKIRSIRELHVGHLDMTNDGQATTISWGSGKKKVEIKRTTKGCFAEVMHELAHPNHDIEILDLDANGIKGPEHMQHVVTLLQKTKSLKTLILDQNRMSVPSFSMLFDQGLRNNRTLTNLKCRTFFGFDDVTPAVLVASQVLADNLCALQQTDLDIFNYGTMLTALSTNRTLTKLRLSLHSADLLNAAGTMLQHNNTIRMLYVNLPDKFEDDTSFLPAFTRFAEGLAANTGLRNVTLSGPNSYSALSVLLELMHSNTCLQHLTISNNLDRANTRQAKINLKKAEADLVLKGLKAFVTGNSTLRVLEFEWPTQKGAANAQVVKLASSTMTSLKAATKIHKISAPSATVAKIELKHLQ